MFKRITSAAFLAILMLCAVFCQAQKGIAYALKAGGSINKKYERIVGDTILNCNGRFVYDKKGNYVKTIPVKDKYWIVEYNYGEPPPDQFEIARLFLTRDSVCRGWGVSFKNLFDMHGYTEGFQSYLVTSKNDNATFFFKTYSDTLHLSYGMGEYDLELSIKSAVIK